VQEVAELVGLETLLDRKPKQLSGGQRQRVALGRAIIRTPRVFLFDEPLSNLDAQLRLHMRAEIVNLQKRLGITGIYVTHDQAEAMTMGDRIAVLNKGKLMQIGTPQEIYQSPNNLFVAGFLGSPNMNFFIGSAHSEGDAIHFSEENGGAAFTIPHSVLATHMSIPKHITVGIRPEHCSTHAYEILGPIWNTTINQSEYHGHEMILHMLSGGTRKSMRLPVSEMHPNGKDISVHFDVNHMCIFSTETGERL
jgi:multiple sugar transport system ATP-binding protein